MRVFLLASFAAASYWQFPPLSEEEIGLLVSEQFTMANEFDFQLGKAQLAVNFANASGNREHEAQALNEWVKWKSLKARSEPRRTPSPVRPSTVDPLLNRIAWMDAVIAASEVEEGPLLHKDYFTTLFRQMVGPHRVVDDSLARQHLVATLNKLDKQSRFALKHHWENRLRDMRKAGG